MIAFRLLLAELLTCLARLCLMGLEEPSPVSPREQVKRSVTEHLHRCYQIDSSDHQP
jgi:hypothetical protein